jgi:carbon storage regulator
MLVVTRKLGESILIDDGITISDLEIHGHGVRLGIRAPKDLSVLREELAAFHEWHAESDAVEKQ